ncbi:hypothetical protein Tco_0729645 [Tanacetum coccineum]|uniref:Xylulose kinase-1 n=1 Tax=Tanacetum coccineum TaxID=301880 RepID=A0ABQ4YPF8_9ASTR
MTTLKFADTHNMVAFLSNPTDSDGFEQIVDFLNARPIRHALTINPTIYISCIEQFWSTVVDKTINGEAQLHALVDGKKIIIIESSVRRDLQLADEKGIDCLPNFTIFEQLTLMGSKTNAWNEFSSTMASAIIYLATNQKFNFSKFIFESMIRNLENVSGKFVMYPRKPKRKDTQVPQSGDPMENVVDEVVHKELGDSLVRAATTASSLEAEHDSGSIIKTRSKATPNESISQGTNSGGNTLQSDKDRLKLDELMALCTTLQNRVLDLEKTKTSQHNEISSLKRRVEKLEKRNRSRTHKLKRIDAIDADEDITLVSVHDVDVSASEEVFVAKQEVADEMEVVKEVVEVINTAKQIIDATQVSAAGDKVSTVSAATTVNTATTTTATTIDDITLAQVLEGMKSTKPKQKRVVIQELGESTATKSSQLSSQQSQCKGKGILAKIDADHQLAERLQAQEQEELSIKEKATLF